MPKGLPAAVITQMDAEQKRPAILVELGLSSILRYAATKMNVIFPTGGNIYTAKAIKARGINQSLEGQIQRITIYFDNVTRDMAAYANNEYFKGKSIIIKRVYLDALGNASNYNEVFNGYMETPSEIGREWLTVPASVGKPLNHKTLKIAYQKLCPWAFGGSECNTNGNADLTSLKASGTADSGSISTLVDNALTQVDDYWNYGEIEITKGSKTYYRRVKDFVASSDTITLDVELPVTVDNTCTYTVYKGCDQTWDTCGAGNAWGPSANNQANFGGCLHIVKPIREISLSPTPPPPGPPPAPGSTPPEPGNSPPIGGEPPGNPPPIGEPYGGW